MKRLFLFTLILLATLAAAYPNPIRRAQKKMEVYNYSRAIEILLKAADKSRYHEEAVPLLAQCYKMQRNVQETLKWSEKAAMLPNAKPEWILDYANALKANGKYPEAREKFDLYLKNKPSDTATRLQLGQIDILLEDWSKLEPCFEIRPLPSLNSPQSDFGPAYYANGFTFTSDRGYLDAEDKAYGWTGRQYLNILFSKPLNNGDFFGEYRKPVTMRDRFNQSFHDGPASFAGDTVAMFTRSFRDRNAKVSGKIRTNYLKLFENHRISGEWQELKAFEFNDPGFSVGHPGLSSDNTTLYFASDMPGGYGGVDLWKCTREGEAWSKPVNLGPLINTRGNEMFPYLRHDGILFFASDGLPGYGGLDLFMSAPVDGNFTSPDNLRAPMNSSYDDFSITWIPGTSYGLFASDRPGGLGLDDLYAFRKLPVKEIPREKNEQFALWGQVKDKLSGKPLEGVTVFILDENTDSVYVVKTDAEGRYQFVLPHRTSLIIKASESMYIPDCLTWLQESLVPDQPNQAPRELLLDKLEMKKNFTLKNIYYDFDKYDIRPDAEPALDELVSIMKSNPITIELASHTDSRGTFEYNDLLSLRRAESAVNYLVMNGIEKERITSRGYGEHQLVNKCADKVKCSEGQHQENRRTEFSVTSIRLPAQDSIEPGKYEAGKTLLRDQLPADFFMNCR